MDTVDMSLLRTLLPLIIPLAVIQIGLMVAALVHIFRHNTYKTGTRALWVVLSICINTIGPILYFTVGKGED